MFLHLFLSPVRAAAHEVGLPVCAWVFPFLMSDYYAVLIILFGFILLLCDAPFVDTEQFYLIIRCGKKTWLIGQLLYVFFSSVVYFLFILLLSILLLFPNISFSGEWGKLLRTLAQTDLAPQFHVTLGFPYKIIQLYSPFAAVCLSFAMALLVGFFLGMVLFVTNGFLSRSAGVVVSSAFILLEVFSVNNAFRFTYFSPASWTSLSVLDVKGFSKYPSIFYACIVLVLSCALLCLLAMLWVKHREMNASSPI